MLGFFGTHFFKIFLECIGIKGNTNRLVNFTIASVMVDFNEMSPWISQTVSKRQNNQTTKGSMVTGIGIKNHTATRAKWKRQKT